MLLLWIQIIKTYTRQWVLFFVCFFRTYTHLIYDAVTSVFIRVWYAAFVVPIRSKMVGRMEAININIPGAIQKDSRKYFRFCIILYYIRGVRVDFLNGGLGWLYLNIEMTVKDVIIGWHIFTMINWKIGVQNK